MASSIPIFPMSPPLFDSERAQRRRMPHLPTSSIDTKTTLSPTTDSVRSPHPDAATANDSAAASSPTSPSRQRIVLTDHVAFRYLEEDPSTIVLSRRQQLEGYEIYLVEQWACSREHPTFIITTYTGNPKDTVWTSILSVPADESQWSPQMRLYFKALEKYHARSKETPLGNLMITNLSGFPSSLTVIPVPEGDMKKYRELFFVNENLKRLGCSGRLGIQLAPPSGATQAKFHQLYRVSDKIPLNSSVIELVKLCQVALVLFGKLEPEYADGLLCDVTERAINDWWLEFGAEYYTAEPHDGILGPTTVAALLGMLMGARNRLSACNAPVAKDVFDIASTKRGIAYFQKTQRIAKTRRLDRQTLERLRKATTKAASKESWAVPRAFKSTVAELGGKGGEMVMGIVGAGEKAGIADIETVDIDRFVELVQGEHAKWLWHGKPRKTPTGDMFSRLPGEERSTSPDERSYPGKLLKRESTLEGHSLAKRDTIEEPAEGFEKEKEKEKSREKDKEKRKEKDRDKEREKDSKRAAIKRATGIIESGSGFHRIRGKVGLLSHQSKYKDDDCNSIKADLQSPQSFTADGTPSSTAHERLPLGDNRMSDTYSLISPQRTIAEEEPTFSKVLTETPKDSMTTLAADQTQLYVPNAPATEEELTTNPPTAENSTAGSIYNNIDEKLPFDETNVIPPLLRRTQSADQLDSLHISRNENWWPRRLSFSMAEEAIFKWTSIIPTCTDLEEEDNAQETSTLAAKMATYNLITEEAKRLQHQLSLLSTTDATWVSTHLSTLATLSTALDADISELDSIYFPRLDDYQTINDDVHDLLLRTRTQLQESLREMANLGDKLDYEIGTLRSKVEDVEDGVVELERQVQEVESRVVELEGVTGERE